MPSSDAVKSGGFLAGGRAEDIVKQPKTVERRYSGHAARPSARAVSSPAAGSRLHLV
jgi:hypothetical protein